MSFFRSQFSDVVEWEEFRDDMIFWKWSNREIKKGSKLIIQPGQDAIFLNNGRTEGIFEDPGEYDIESQIVPFLSTLKGFRFGFNTGMRVEVLFINTKEFTVKWGTRNAIHIPTERLPGGLPIRANGTFSFKVNDYISLIDKVAGVKKSYLVNDIKIRITSILDQLLMKWITREGKDMFNLQANAFDIAKGIQEDLDMEIMDIGMKITEFTVNSFNYPKEIQDMITTSASHEMIGDVNRYQQVKMTDGMASGKVSGSGTTSDMAGMMMGMKMANEMVKNMDPNQQQNTQQPNQHGQHPRGQQPNQQAQQSNQHGQHQRGQQPNQQAQQKMQPNQNNQTNQNNQASGGNKQMPNFCPNCGQKTTGSNFCPNCGNKLV